MLDDVATWLYVPGIRPELFTKAAAAADGIVIDLEDAVHPRLRDEARQQIAAFFAENQVEIPVLVRANPVGTADFDDDLALLEPLVRSEQVAGIRLSKIDTPDDARRVASATRSWRSAPILICQLETAKAVRSAFEIASVEGVHSIMLGEADLRADLRLPLGSEGDPGLRLARETVVLASRAAGLPSPVGAAFTNVQDEETLRTTSRELRALGFYGRSCIHPRQVQIVREVFLPSEEERAAAEQIVARATEMDAEGSASAANPGGTFIDPAVVKHARSVLARGR